jgi:uncharacterized membrane protein HdeD (DUF308 family)
MTQDPSDNLPEPLGPQDRTYQQEWMDPQVATVDPGRIVGNAVLTLAVITGVFGAIMLFWPGATVRVVAILFGFWLILSGVIMLVQAIGSRGNAFLRALLGIGGVLSLVIGGICVVNGDASERILVLFVVIGWLANGIAYLIVGLRNKQSASRGFYLFFGTLQVVLALLIIAWPSATVTVLVRVIGIGLLITAAFGVWASNRIRKAGSDGQVVIVSQ